MSRDEERVFKSKGRRPGGGSGSYAILRVTKLKTKGNIGGSLAHTFRERETPNADLERRDQNTVLKGRETAQGVMADWDARAPEKIRKNGVQALEYFVGGSPEKLKAMSREEQDAYFGRALDWLKARHGAENVLSAVVHRDETSPHLTALVIPLDQRGKMNASEFTGGRDKLREMQTSFAQDVGQEFGLKRGLEGSKATHQTIREYYARARTPIEPDFSLPERQRGSFLGYGRESDEEWRQRASAAVSERIRAVATPLLEESIALEKRVAQLEGALEKAKRDVADMDYMRQCERQWGEKGLALVESGQAAHIEDQTAAEDYQIALDYLKARQDVFGENHFDAIHRLHGHETLRELSEKAQGRERDSGMDWG